ncbi:MAG TPA: hypothetical protein VD788_03095, partial [Candidatus Polarisedimenticolaceae bacterium]|nr:hypothetical protein [Candidatus Polarisedimenticolaceae bacterium]
MTQQPPGPHWDLTGASCSDGSDPAAIELLPGETVVCTFENTKRGQLIVSKTAVGGDGTFAFDSATLGGFALPTSAGSASTTFPLLVPGVYDVTESALAEWDLTSTACSDGSAPGAIVVDPGETVTCVFENTKRGVLVVVKETVGGDGIFSFASGTLGAFELATTGGAASETFAGLPPGVYDVAESDPAPAWDLTAASCSDGSDPSSIAIDPGETVTCTFRNTKRSRLIVAKTTIGDDGTFAFLSASLGAFELGTDSGAGSVAFDDLRPGIYDVSESDPTPAWDLTAVSCSDGSAPGAIELSPGESVTCTFENTRRGRIVVVKTSIGGDGAFEFASQTLGAFELVTADGAASIQFDDLPPGPYDVSELDAGSSWDLTAVACSDGSDPASIDLDPGETVSCAFENTKRGRLTIVKNAIGGDGMFGFTSAALGAFELETSNGTAVTTFDDLIAGSYDVTELDQDPDWDLTAASCSDGSLPAAVRIDPGEQVSCTFENTKRGRLVVEKVSIGSDGTFAFDSATLGDFALITSSGAASHGFDHLLPGVYDVHEVDGDGTWDLTGASCDDGSPLAAIDIAPGETVTCTFANTKRARLTIVKRTIPDDPQDFHFTASGDSFADTFSLDDDGDASDALSDRFSAHLVPGDYLLVESDPGPLWDAAGVVCTDGSGADTGDVGLRTAALGLAAGADVTCVFTDVKRGRIVVDKVVEQVPFVPDYDRAQWPFDFSTDYAGSFSLRHGESHDSGYIRSNQRYLVSEAGQRGWVVGHECRYPDGSMTTGGATAAIDLAPGAEVSCTFFNVMRLHPGSSGFWRNWRNQYASWQLEDALADGFSSSPIYDDLFDPATGVLLPSAVDTVDRIYDNRQDQDQPTQPLLREITSTMFNLTVSNSTDPVVAAMQQNDDICYECLLDLSSIPGADELLERWS